MAFCREQGIEFTRSRPYRKNDQAWVEQKNGAVVRRMVGYGRLEGVPAAEALARLYSAARPVRERLPAVVQAGRRRRATAAVFGSATMRRRRRARAPVGVGRDSRCDEGPAARGARYGGPARAVGRDSGRPASSRRPSPRGRRSIRCRNVTPTSTGSCGASRSHGAPARCGRPIGFARDHPDTGAPGWIRTRTITAFVSTG